MKVVLPPPKYVKKVAEIIMMVWLKGNLTILLFCFFHIYIFIL
jgi:hypothetical protein